MSTIAALMIAESVVRAAHRCILCVPATVAAVENEAATAAAELAVLQQQQEHQHQQLRYNVRVDQEGRTSLTLAELLTMSHRPDH